MSYVFSPLSDEELDSLNLIDEGIYNFEVLKSTCKVSKSNNPMAELQIKVWDRNGKTHTVFDYLVFSKVNLNIRKVKHFCDTVGLHEAYKKGEMPERLEGFMGQVHVGIQEPMPNPHGGMYAKKNIVLDYVATDKDSATHEVKEEPKFDDEIPF